MTPLEESNLTVVEDYLRALESDAAGDELARFFTPDAVQEEFPNRLNPSGQRSDLTGLLERSERGRGLLKEQRYAVRSKLARGDSVALEVEWTATLAVPVGGLPAGGGMRAAFAIFFDLVDGRIRSQRNYDCFDPW